MTVDKLIEDANKMNRHCTSGTAEFAKAIAILEYAKATEKVAKSIDNLADVISRKHFI